jgi:hypothetical protein
MEPLVSRTPVVLTLAAVALAACSSSADGPVGDSGPSAAPSPTTGGEVAVSYDFEDGSDGWASDITDYTEATRPDDFLSETGVAPPGLDAGTDHVHLAATNTSDDLFMFLRREVGPELPLAPDTAYEVAFTVEFASNAPTDCVGIGGAPGESVWLKVGATPEEPVPASRDGDSRLSVDKGGQSQGGEAAEVAGDVANGIPCEEAQEQDLPYADVMVDHTLTDPVTTTADGTMWLFVGTDSGFEGRTSLYYDRIEVTLTPAVQPPADDA